MNDMTAYTIDTGFWSERYRPEPIPHIGKPPCEGCEHITRCSRESLACCAFAAWMGRRDVRVRSTHREPSAEWYDYAERLGEVGLVPPKCEQCKTEPRRARADNGKTPHGETQAKITALLAEHPGLLKREIAQRLGITEKAVLGGLRSMMQRGMVEVCGIQITARKAQLKKYALRECQLLDRIVALLVERPNLRSQEVGDALGLTWQEALGRLEMLHALGRIEYGHRRKGVRVWRVGRG